MKNLLAILLMTVSSIAVAGPKHGHHGHHRHWHSNHSWVVPALIGGAVVYAATRSDPVIIQQPTIVLQPNQVMIDGVVYNKQIMIINGVQTEVLVKAS
jgi:hypothetical protein